MTGRHDRPVAAPPSFAIHTSSSKETEAVGSALGTLLREGDIVALSGELGAGKTTFTRGIAIGAGTTDHVASPTFTLIRRYHGPVTIFHADLYRLDEPAQLDDLGFEEILESDAIVVIEWADKAGPRLPPEYLWIELRFTEKEEGREISMRPMGARYSAMISRLMKKRTK